MEEGKLEQEDIQAINRSLERAYTSHQMTWLRGCVESSLTAYRKLL